MKCVLWLLWSQKEIEILTQYIALFFERAQAVGLKDSIIKVTKDPKFNLSINRFLRSQETAPI